MAQLEIIDPIVPVVAVDVVDRLVAGEGAVEEGKKNKENGKDKEATIEMIASTQAYERHLVSERVAARHIEAKDGDARAARFLAKWSKADAAKLDGAIRGFNAMALDDLHRAFIYIQVLPTSGPHDP